MSHQTNLTRIKAVCNALGELNEKVVFVGGATVSLYVDTSQADELRPTEDVDILIEVFTYEGITLIEEQLRQRGFQHDVTSSSNYRYRYRVSGVIVDLMPMDEEALGFVNQWYERGFHNSIEYVIDEIHNIRIFDSPYFIASKLEAFKNRGQGDGRTSTDFEDISFILENKTDIWEELKTAKGDVRSYLKKEFSILLKNPDILEEWIYSHTSKGSPPAAYFIMEELKEFVNSLN